MKPVIFIIISAILLRIASLVIQLNQPNYSFEQDHYLEYADALQKHALLAPSFLSADQRLFPGYPVLIGLLSSLFGSTWNAAIFISLASGVLAIVFFYLISSDSLSTFVFSFLPPIWLRQSVKIATEPLTIMFLLASLFAFVKKRPFLAGILVGLSSTVRFISVCLFLAELISFHKKEDRIKITLGFAISFSLLFLFNFSQFGAQGIFIQFLKNPVVGGAGGTTYFGFWQIIKDLFRAWDWKQYRIIISGICYLVLNFATCWQLYKFRKISSLVSVCFLWVSFSLLFIFSISPIPLLEEFSRFSVPFCAAVVLAFCYFPRGKKVGHE